jgi:hypothetical protein
MDTTMTYVRDWMQRRSRRRQEDGLFRWVCGYSAIGLTALYLLGAVR